MFGELSYTRIFTSRCNSTIPLNVPISCPYNGTMSLDNNSKMMEDLSESYIAFKNYQFVDKFHFMKMFTKKIQVHSRTLKYYTTGTKMHKKQLYVKRCDESLNSTKYLICQIGSLQTPILYT